jgi:hypothetical protein
MVLLAGLVTAGVAGSGPDSDAAGRPARGSRSAAPAPRGGSLPDTVLARVGDSRRITRSTFARSWAQVEPAARPDTLTPETAREFLELLIGKEALAERAMREPFTWTDRESAEYRGLRDNLTLRVVFDSAMAETRAALAAEGDTTADPELLGVKARVRMMTRLGVVRHEPALESVARAFAALPRPSRDSSLMAQLRILGASPVLAPGEDTTALASWPGGRFTGRDLLEAWSRMNPVARQRPESASQVGDLIENAMFERALRRAAEERGIERWPDIAGELARKREYFAVEHYVGNQVYAKIPMDSATVFSHYRQNRERWRLPLRVRLLQFVLPGREAAEAMAVRIADGAEAESLQAQAIRIGVSYRVDLAAAQDSALFRRVLAAGPSAILGPDSIATGWRVVRVNEVLPSRLREFGEVRRLALQSWYGEEGERRMVELVDRVRREAAVVVNERALAKLDPSVLGP